MFDIPINLTDTQLNLAETLVYCFFCVIYLLIYYVIVSAIIDVTILFILSFLVVKLYLCLLTDLSICCVSIKVQPASFHQRKDTLKQLKSSETKPLGRRQDSKVVKIVISLSHLPPPSLIRLIRLFLGVNKNLCRYSASPCLVHGTYGFN